jgi:hypothetical protein
MSEWHDYLARLATYAPLPAERHDPPGGGFVLWSFGMIADATLHGRTAALRVRRGTKASLASSQDDYPSVVPLRLTDPTVDRVAER